MRLRATPVFYCLLSALLLSLSWYFHLTICIFFAFTPLLILEEKYRLHEKTYKKKLFLWVYLCFLLWNVGVTWWVYCVEFGKGGAVLAFAANSLLMALVFLVYTRLRLIFKDGNGAWIFVPLWIAWEHLHTLWDLAWTWLTVGNVFAFTPHWIQWYELTGTSGGTLWALAVNVLFYKAVRLKQKPRLLSRITLRIALTIIVPILFSYLIYFFRLQLPDARNKVQVTIVQPNIDPYGEKFSTEYSTQFQRMLEICKGKVDENTDYLVLPETFIAGFGAGLNELDLNASAEIQIFRDSLISKYPRLKIVAGGNTYVLYDHPATSTARHQKQDNLWYDVYNTGILIDSASVHVYHKSKLVPGVERMPFPALLKPLEGLAIDMGGTVGSLGTQDTRGVFIDSSSRMGVAPVICYESVFADYVTEYIRNGANMIFIITNDGWWDDTPGYVQHLNIGRLRAIENRRPIARSANTGTSCFIDQLGNISEETEWWKPAVISKAIYKNDELTFFSRFGDLISYASLIISLLFLMYWLLDSRLGRFLKLRGRS